jgi:hypothetical protein
LSKYGKNESWWAKHWASGDDLNYATKNDDLVETLENAAKNLAKYSPVRPKHYADLLEWKAAKRIKELEAEVDALIEELEYHLKERTSHMAKSREYKVYPSTPNIRSGCKVGWRYYDRLIDAKSCADAARHNAKIKESLGYDFGYCSPGSIRQVERSSPYTGKYEVCIP